MTIGDDETTILYLPVSTTPSQATHHNTKRQDRGTYGSHHDTVTAPE
jgi:hypothetical protein